MCKFKVRIVFVGIVLILWIFMMCFLVNFIEKSFILNFYMEFLIYMKLMCFVVLIDVDNICSIVGVLGMINLNFCLSW